jgi:hypothetical protein
MEKTILELEQENHRLKSCVTFLGNCLVATAENLPKRTGRRERSRHKWLCHELIGIMTSNEPLTLSYYPKDEEIVKRCESYIAAFDQRTWELT